MDNDKTDIPEFYVNSMEFSSGQYDLIVYIGQRDNEGKTSRKAKLLMSWPHAKKVVEVLGSQVEMYEKMYNEVKTDPNKEAIEELKKSGKIIVREVEPLNGD